MVSLFSGRAAAASVFLCVVTSSAMASDWSGFYVGSGASFSEHSVEFPDGADSARAIDSTAPGVVDRTNTAGSLNQSGNAIGGHILGGVRYQWDKFVFGVEADYEMGSSFGSAPPPGTPACIITGVVTTGNFACVGVGLYAEDVETLGHIRTTAGFEITPNTLAYVAGGLAIGRSPDTITARAGGQVASSPSAPLFGQTTDTRSGIGETIFGYTLGGGVEAKVGGGLSLRTEYVYDNFGSTNITGASAGFAGTLGELTSIALASTGDRINYSSQTVRVSAIYQFDDDEPLPASVTDSDWAGFYFGGGLTMERHQVGFPDAIHYLRMFNSATNATREYRPSTDYEGDSVGGHLLAGYAHQWGRFVLGAEADIEIGSSFSKDARPIDQPFADLAGPECLNSPIPSGDPGDPMTSETAGCVGLALRFGEVRTYGHIRAKVGFEITPALLVFATGGVAAGSTPDYLQASVSGIIGSSPSAPLVGAATVTRGDADKDVYGYSIGGGLEVKASQHFRIRTEYIYDDYGTVEVKPVGGAGFGGTIGNLTTNSFVSPGNKVDLSSQTVRITGIYQF